MTKTPEERAQRVARVEKILRAMSSDAMKSSASGKDVDEYVKACRNFIELLAAHENEIWGGAGK